MDIIDSIKRDKAYLKCKLIVKRWEKDFKAKQSRTPSKFDIKDAPPKIKYAYKKYFQLKSAALDNSLSVCDIDFDLDLDSMCSPEPSLIDSASSALSPRSEALFQTLPSGQELEQMLSEAKTKESENQTSKSNPVKPLSPFTNNLSKKLFESRKFSMRNPRKLSMYKSQLSQENIETAQKLEQPTPNIETNEITVENIEKEDLDVSMTNISKDFDLLSSANIFETKKVREINEGWLKRATGLSFEYKPKDTNQIKESFGLSNVTLPLPAAEKQCDYVENSESEGEDPEIKKLKPALKKRKYSHSPKDTLSLTCPPNFDNSVLETTASSSVSKTGKRTRKATSTKAKAVKPDIDDQQPPDISDFMPFGVENDIKPRHTNISSALKNIKVSKADVKDSKHRDTSSGSDKLEQKIKSGTLNENFVKINIEKKVFVRGKKNISYSKYKKQLWKDKKALHGGMEFPEGGKVACFKCGQQGHMARYCTAHRGDGLLPLNTCGEDEDDMPTLEDMEATAFSKGPSQVNDTEEIIETLFKPSSIPESFLKMLGDTTEDENSLVEVKPIYAEHKTATSEVQEALKLFGHETFRPGQEEAIMRILSGKSTLLLLSTGGGKSLCYQLPAYIYRQQYKCITLVISPLVSLMEDQVVSMPDFLQAGCLHTNQPPTQRQKIMKLIQDGELGVLLISPEALIAGDSSSGLKGLFKSLPPIAFACIDEAHCVSQWSHNFRPSYLMLCRVLRDKLNVKCILGLTATASQSTVKSVIEHIHIPDGISGVITSPAVPENLLLSISFEKDKDRALVTLLSSELMDSYKSIIVYCIRRDECERIAAVLRSSLQEPGKYNMEKPSKKRKRMSYIAEAYHAGMSAAQRRKIQNNFMDGTIRIIVATVAFGMGINKSDIRSIIHYNMPSSFESYVQEIGRAGRDGKPAHCHVFMGNNNNDKNELLKHIHSNSIDRPVIRKLLQKVFVPCECGKNKTEITSASNRCKGHEVGIPIDETVEELDLASENISTLLCYLELHPTNHVKVLNNAYTVCKIMSYGGPKKIAEAAKNCPPLAMAYVLESKRNSDFFKSSVLEFKVIEVAAAIGWESGMVKYHLKNLEWITEGSTSRRSQLKVEFNTLGFRIKAPGDLNTAELDKMLDDLHGTVLGQEKASLHQLEEINKCFTKLGSKALQLNDSVQLLEKSNELKILIRNYFQRDNNFDADIQLEERPLDEERVASDTRALIVAYKDCDFTGRSIARIFQGISSPNYPALVWGRCKFWRAHLHEDFYGLVRIATQQLIQMK